MPSTSPFPDPVPNYLPVIRYKPGWMFEWMHDVTRPSNGAMLLVRFMSPDAREWANDYPFAPRQIQIGMSQIFTGEEVADYRAGNVLRMVMKIRAFLLRCETHELDEFLRVNGEQIHDPHDMRSDRPPIFP